MDSFILSDLHIGIDEPESLFAGGQILPQLLARLAAEPAPVRIILNGDTFDFLTGEGDPVLDAQAARAAMQRLAKTPLAAEFFSQLGAVLARGGEVVIRLGNHDLELALTGVQQVIRDALAQPPAIASRLLFTTGERPMMIEVGGTRVLVTHGEHDDPFNRIDYESLLPSAAGTKDPASGFRYPAGSLLMRKIVSPLRRKYNLRFLDFLKPDFQGAVLVALAVAPEACRELFQSATWDIGWQLLRRSNAGLPFAADGPDEPELGLAARVDDSALSAREHDELHDFIAESEGGFAFSTSGLSEGIRAKLIRSGLSLYARAHRALAGQVGADFFRIEPSPQETRWAAALGQRHDADAVFTGHTHAARFVHDGGRIYINSGTWIWLMRLPPPSDDLDAWTAFLNELRENPTLDPARQHLARLERLLTVITARAHPGGGARLALTECQADGTLRELRAANLPRSQPAGRSQTGGSHV